MHRRHQQAERRLAPARLNLPIFRSTDANADVTYEIWHFDVQGWLDQYDEASMCPFTFLVAYKVILGNGLAPYQEVWTSPWMILLRCMDHTFGNVCDYDSMIQIVVWNPTERKWNCQGVHAKSPWSSSSGETCMYPDQVPNEGEGLRRDRFYYGLTPSLRDALSFAMADLPGEGTSRH